MGCFLAQEHGRSHRNIGQRKDGSTDQCEHHDLRHGLEHLAFDADQGKNGQVHDQDDHLSEGG